MPEMNGSTLRRNQIPRRSFLRGSVVGSLGVSAALFVGCGDDNDDIATETGAAGVGSEPTSAASAAAGEPRTGGTLRVGIGTGPQYLDPHAPGSGNDHRIFWTMHEGIVTYDSEGLPTTEGALSSEWEQPDDLTYIFRLREGVKFHDGTSFNAEAVKANFDRVRNPATNSPGAPELDMIDTLDLVSDYEIRLTTTRPWAPFLVNLGDRGGQMVSPTAAEERGEDLRRNPVGTGPFMFEEWITDDRVAVKRNPDYWGKDESGVQLPYLDGIVWQIIPDATVRNANLDSGDMHMLLDVEEKDVESLSQKYGGYVTPGARISIQLFNWSMEPLTDPRVRQAMTYAIDRESILKAVFFDVGRLANGVVYPIYGYAFDDNRPSIERDIAKSRELLTAAGYQDGISVDTIAIPNNIQRVEVLQSQFADTGINIQNRHVEIPAYRQEFFFDHTVPIAYSSFTARADVDGVVRQVWHSEGFWNTGHIPNAELDSLIDDAASTLDAEERKAKYSQISDIAYEEALHVGEVFEATIAMTGEGVMAFDAGFDGKGRWRTAWLKG